ncbi:MAG TPA: helix-turn-helix transcriptional regulator, partial [Pseudonocardia sp.]|nr:helix-turn-helix transcriptional regulator [Pseudonocardia sp.]
MRESTELGALLRHWRARVTPEEVGLVAGPRRRVTGLRRPELARLAGVSTDYLVQLEQGRSGVPSVQVLTSLARALGVSPVERDHLLRLAGHRPPSEHAVAEPAADVVRLVDQLDATPAAVYDVRWDLVTWNPLWTAVHGDPLSRPVRERNMMWRFLTDLPSRVQRSAAEDRQFQQTLVGDLRARVGQHPHDDRLTDFVADLNAASPRFRGMWEAHRIDAYRHEPKTIAHPEAGTLHLDCDVLPAGSDDLRLVV